MSSIGSPVFVVGTGRSGSTIFHKMLCLHHDVAWVNRILIDNPSNLRLHRAYLGMVDLPLIGGWIQRNGLTPAEAYSYWDQAYRGFGRPMRDLTADDVSERARDRFRRAIEAITTSSRQRPLVKVTGWPRVGFLAEIFPDAHFVHVIRDGRAVANSFLNVEFWEGWRGPHEWRFGMLSDEHEEEWQRHDRSFVALAGIGWKILMDAMEEAEMRLPEGRLLTLRYEDICAHPIETFREATRFTGLEWNERFAARIGGTPVASQNEKWKKDLTPDQQRVLTSVLRPHLVRLGYEEFSSQTVDIALE